MKNIILITLITFILNGCASMDNTLYGQVSARQKELVKIYDYPYDEVYKAIVSVLERRLSFHVQKTYTTNDTIYSSYASSPFTFLYKGAYVYLFKLKSIDSAHTQVSLKAQGPTIVVSDNDMLNRYIPEELKYLSSK
jgi:starvation-inducible outer membrane lipoprotein